MYLVLLPLLLVMSCSSPLKYKHSFTKDNLSSDSDEDVKVAKIEIVLKENKLFASGMDSTVIRVKLYDQAGHELSKVDPADLTLSTSEDLEAKPFVLKQGVYKAELLPRVKSPNVLMQVDWMDRVRSQVVSLHMTMAPLKSALKPLTSDFPENKSFGEVIVTRTIASDLSEGFNFTNVGGNRIVKDSNASRGFSFDYPEQARQNVALEVYDVPDDKVSHTMHSIFMFFPRKQLPVVEQLTGVLNVTLPTGEKMLFQKESKEIVGGVFEEGVLDLNQDLSKRQYPNLKYKGKGVMIRVNAQGQSPQIMETDDHKIDLVYGFRGTKEVLVINGLTGQRCRRPKAEFWEPLGVQPIEFKFPNDYELDLHLKSVCGFGLPKL